MDGNIRKANRSDLIKELEKIKGYDDWNSESLYETIEKTAKSIITYKENDKYKTENANQLRNIFNLFQSTMRKFQKKEEVISMQLLKARITYIYSKGNIHKDLYETYKLILEKIMKSKPKGNKEKTEWINNVKKFIEAFYAYTYLHSKKN